MVENADQAVELSRELGFPLLVRPSYVLGGQRMKIVINEQDLERHVIDILRDMPDNKILLDHFLDGAMECEADAICDGDEVRIVGIMQHIEPAGIHSGDSYAVLPLQPGRYGHPADRGLHEAHCSGLGDGGVDQHPICGQGRRRVHH